MNTLIATIDSEAPRQARTASADLRAGPVLKPSDALAVRRTAALEGCKWDAQVGDVSTLAPFPLVMKASLWRTLAAQAEALTAEALAAEREIAARKELVCLLGLPRSLVKVLGSSDSPTPAAGRIIRFDFHLCTDGWRISEANSDVPGGFTEASHFTRLMAAHYPGLLPAGDPAESWCSVLAESAGAGGVVALLSAAGYMEDHQVIAFLAARLRERGCRAILAKPGQIHWQKGRAHFNTLCHVGPVDVIVRFYQAEWLSRLRSDTGWRSFFRGGCTPVANPVLAVISESKRFPLTWDCLSTRLPAWRALLPETRDPREAPWATDDGWLLKTAMCNTGDTVSIRECMKPADWRWTRWKVCLAPHQWLAQRRFDSIPVMTPIGLQHVCVGIYTVNGRAAGAYARLAEKPLIDFSAVDVALLLEDDE